jgi:DNA polymerase I-like protein with 3'-5' exonuclease and polymerase domains
MTSIAIKTPRPPAPPPVGGRFAVSGRVYDEKKAPACVIIDAETEAIEGRPNYPPRPVGWAVRLPGERKGRYATGEEGARRLKAAYASGLPILCQHGKFDLEVAERHHGLALPPWDRTHDTEYLIFLRDPHAKSLSLKPSAERVLGMAPEEQDRVRDWILANVPEAKRRPSEFGAYICRAPEKLVAPYAVGDLERTGLLFGKLYPEVCARGMRDAYDRERRLMPILLEAERVGIRTDFDAMERDLPVFQRAREKAGDWLRKALRAPGLNLDSDREVGEILFKRSAVTEWSWTKGGKNKAPQRSVSKKTMTLDKFRDPKLAAVYGYYQRCGTFLSFFLEKWLELAGPNGGWLRPNWNQVRGDRGGTVGTRSGRPSCDEPNLLAIVKKWENSKGDGYHHPAHIDLPELPLARKYLLPDEGGILIHRDFNQQELRLMAHFEGGSLAERYRERPYRNADGEMRFDIHSAVQAGIRELTGIELNRDSMKEVNFGPLYGKGQSSLAERLGVDLAQVAKITAARDALMPGVRALNDSIKAWGRSRRPIVTWGGREYYMEPDKYVEKFHRVMEFSYKLMSYLIQPSAADMTKEAMLAYQEHPRREGRFVTQVYDEINVSTPSLKGLSAKGRKDCVAREMRALRESMELQPCSVPMLSDGKTGPSWGELAKYWNKEEATEIV